MLGAKRPKNSLADGQLSSGMHKSHNRGRGIPFLTRSQSEAFTLIELLVVLAIIAILAALLLPGLSRAKNAGLCAACKSNLHQIGIALHLYVGEYGKYPAAAANDGSFTRTGYVLWDRNLLAFAANNRDLFICQANHQAQKWTNSNAYALQRPNSSYGYNMAGTGRYPTQGTSLGLDGGHNGWNGGGTFVSEQQVVAPSDLVAVSDVSMKTGGEDNDLDDIFPINVLAEMNPARHNLGANAVFCDNHVEYGKLRVWLQKASLPRSRWNIDHQPHPETWSNNP
jgi:prepilin-type N-terminal cleavage/methylation domain-containing protein/prepilin-type processing-associated H-X9-DG protein